MNDDTDTPGTETDGQPTEEPRSFVRPIPQSYWDMTHEEKREFVRLLLGSLSPSPEVRRRSNDELDSRGAPNVADNPRGNE